MIRLTTPTHKFTFENDPSAYKRILISYAQNGKIVLEKTEADLTFEGDNVASFVLSQEETALFKANTEVTIQVRVLYDDGSAYASDYMKVPVKGVLNGEILT